MVSSRLANVERFFSKKKKKKKEINLGKKIERKKKVEKQQTSQLAKIESLIGDISSVE